VDKIDVLITDDHRLFREGMKLILDGMPGINNIHEAENGRECVEYFRKGLKVDIVFMDLEMPEMNGIEATRELMLSYPETKIIALSMYADEDYYTKMIEVGAKGFILKNSDIKEVEEAIHHVASGNNYFSQEILAGFIKNMSRKKEPVKDGKLSEREGEVLYLICIGYSNQEIANTLHISKRTVDKHRENLLLKTNSKNTPGLVIYAIKNGIIEI
jgi:DNA-binding NarL/FixJ family response regulator